VQASDDGDGPSVGPIEGPLPASFGPIEAAPPESDGPLGAAGEQAAARAMNAARPKARTERECTSEC
jgi:hypothetical protein